jgi:hypothetical protein
VHEESANSLDKAHGHCVVLWAVFRYRVCFESNDGERAMDAQARVYSGYGREHSWSGQHLEIPLSVLQERWR